MYDIVTIGTATRDIFLQSPFFKVLRDPEHLRKLGFPTGEAECFAFGGKVEVNKPILVTGGGATNAAVTFARQGLKTAAIVKIGTDESGGIIVKELKKEKIKPISLNDRESASGFSVILISPTGERTILAYRGASENLKEDEVLKHLVKARWVYIAPGGMELEVLNNVVNHLAQKRVNIAINPSSKKLIERKIGGLANILNKSKVVILNREEGAYLTNIPYDREKRIFRVLDAAVPGIAVMTDGSKGVHISDGHYVWSAGVFREYKVVDRTGAGDAFGSGLVAGLIQAGEECVKGACSPLHMDFAIRLASANATSVIEKIGAKPGILTRRQFGASRWKHLDIRMTKL